MNKLHPIKHDLKTTLWCGPAALAAITGRPTSEVVAAAKKISGKRRIKGMSNWLLKKTADALGFHLEAKYPNDATYLKYLHKPTLARWARENKALFADKPVIVNVTGHYVTVHGRSLIDNQTKKVVSLKRAPHRRCRVHVAFVASPIAPVFQQLAIAKSAESMIVKVAEDSHRTEARRLARQFGIEIEYFDCGQEPRFVYAPVTLDDEALDPFYGEHVVADWKEALERVKTYAQLSTTLPCVMEQ